MESNPHLTAGAMPGVRAMRALVEAGPAWARYRPPFPGVTAELARELGIAFEGEPAGGAGDGGATPPAAGSGSTPPASSTPPPATGAGDDEPLGDAGKRALQDERTKRREAEDREKALAKRVEELESANATDQEKALKDARREAATERDAHWTARLRTSEVRAALRAAAVDPKELDLALRAPEFADLKVADDGSVEGLDDAVDKFRKDHPRLFAPAEPGGGQPNRGAQPGGADAKPKSLEEAIGARYRNGAPAGAGAGR